MAMTKENCFVMGSPRATCLIVNKKFERKSLLRPSHVVSFPSFSCHSEGRHGSLFSNSLHFLLLSSLHKPCRAGAPPI